MSMWSLATRSPKRLVMPRSSSLSGISYSWWCNGNRRTTARDSRSRAAAWMLPTAGSLGRVGRLDLDLARDDVRLQLLDLGLEAGVDLAVELVVRRELHAVVLQRAQVARGGAERGAAGAGGDRLLHGVADVLDDRGQEDVAALRGALAAVLVDPDDRDLAAGALGHLGGAEAGAAGDRQDHVGALADLGVGQRLALGRAGEVVGEAAGLLGLVPAEDLDGLALRL